MAQELPPPIQLMQLLFAFAASRAVGVAAEFRIADLLKEGPKSAEELANRTGVHAPSLYRVLHACASVGVFSEDNEKRFSLTPMAEPLMSDAPGSLQAFAEMMTTDWQFETWRIYLIVFKQENRLLTKYLGCLPLIISGGMKEPVNNLMMP